MMRVLLFANALMALLAACSSTKRVAIETEKVRLTTPAGKQKWGRKLTVESTINRPAKQVWKQLSTPTSALASMKPQAILKPLNKRPLPHRWQTDSTYTFKLVMNGLFPYGKHHVTYETLDSLTQQFQSRESGRSVPVWDHHLKVTAASDSSCVLHEELVIRAGIINWYVASYAKNLFKAKHKRLATQ